MVRLQLSLFLNKSWWLVYVLLLSILNFGIITGLTLYFNKISHQSLSNMFYSKLQHVQIYTYYSSCVFDTIIWLKVMVMHLHTCKCFHGSLCCFQDWWVWVVHHSHDSWDTKKTSWGMSAHWFTGRNIWESVIEKISLN